jgi:iron complex transport system permease protein
VSARLARSIGRARLVLRPRRGGLSLRVDVRLLVVCAALGALGTVAFALSLAWGDFPLPLADVIATLAGGGHQADRFIVIDVRLPRALVAALAGAALAVSGAIFQTLVRNPLAAPDVIGITAGASVAAVTVFVLGASAALIPVAAFGGAIAASALLYVLAWRGGLSPYRLVLVGIGIEALGMAGTTYVLVRGRIEDVQQATVWLVGSLNARAFTDVWPLVAGLAVLAPAVALLARSLDALSLGEDQARALGVRVERARMGLVVAAAGLAAVAVAAAGPIGFVAFIAPHIARGLTKVSGAAALPGAALCGAVLVLASDLVGRLLLSPTEIPVGIVTSVVGAPFFLWLLYRANRTQVVQ